MPHCSSSERGLAETLAATIDDILDVASVGTADFSEYLSANVALQVWEPALAFLILSDGDIVLIDDHGMEEARAVAKDVASCLRDLEHDGPCRLSWERKGVSQTVVAAVLEPDGRNVTVVTLVDTARLGEVDVGSHETNNRILLGALSWIAAARNTDKLKLVARTEQLTAGREALQKSYAHSLTKAVEEREERLREQQEHTSRLKAVMMTAADGIVTIDANGCIETFNAAATEIFGYGREEAIGADVSILFPRNGDSPTRGFYDCLRRNHVTGQHAKPHELLGQRKNGTIFPLELAISDVGFEDQTITTLILRNITERKEAERKLRQLNLFNRMILDSAGEGIVGLDREGRVAFANPAAEQMFGRGSDRLVGGFLHEMVHHSRLNGASYAWEECPVYKTLTEGTVHREDGEVFWREDGSSFPTEYVATPMRDEGKITGAVLTFQDITQRRTLEGQLVQAQKLESIGQLAAGIAHEINTPTQFIGDNLRFLNDAFCDLQPFLSALASEESPTVETASTNGDGDEDPGKVDPDDLKYLLEEVPKAIAQSLEGVERVARIVRSMKEFSHPGSEEMQTVDLNRALESTLTVCRNEWKYVAEVVTDLDPDLPPVTCLPGECNQVFLNLIINAAHAISETHVGSAVRKGTITVRTRRQDDTVEIQIADTGTGISEEARRKVFDPFFTTKQVGRGTGQGLAIARSVVVDKHGGSLTFETEVGRGTAFFIRLPVSTEREGSRR